jgi:hypothetical protein
LPLEEEPGIMADASPLDCSLYLWGSAPTTRPVASPSVPRSIRARTGTSTTNSTLRFC